MYKKISEIEWIIVVFNVELWMRIMQIINSKKNKLFIIMVISKTKLIRCSNKYLLCRNLEQKRSHGSCLTSHLYYSIGINCL